MKIFTPIGSKERFAEMMERVNKIKLNEDFMNNPEVQNTTDSGLLENAFNLLETNQLKIKQSNTQTTGANTFLELIGSTPQGVDMVFRFKIETSEGDQDGVISVNDAELSSLISSDVNIPEGAIALQQFNAQHKAEMIDVVSEYADISASEPELDEEYQKAVEKIESYPFTSKPRTMVTPAQDLDQKPTNPALRVKAPELNKFPVSENNVVTDNPDTANLGQNYYDKASNTTKVLAIENAIKFVDKMLAEKGMSSQMMQPEKYKEMIKHVAMIMFTDKLSLQNEGKKKKKESGEYPDQIGSHFKPKSDYPVEKKKPTKVVQIDELDNMEDMPQVVMPKDSRIGTAKYFADRDIRGHYYKQGTQDAIKHGEEVPSNKWEKHALPYDTQFNEGDTQRGMNNPLLKNYFDKKQQHQQMHEGEEEKPEVTPDEVPAIEQSHEEKGEQLHGGLGDNKSPQEFDQEQVLMGLKVEMEHSDDPTVALEIVLDHLTEDPEYYTIKDDPEASAQANAAKDADEMGSETPTHGQDPNMSDMGSRGMGALKPDDKEEEDILLGFKPHNVGDDLDEEFGYEEYQGNIGDRYEDSEKNTFTVSDKTKGGVGLRGTGGSKQVATSDLLKMKKLGSAVEEAYGQPDPLKIPMLPKDDKIK
jgi:hypothetical protein